LSVRARVMAFLFGGPKKQSQTQILCKKIDIVTSEHVDEPQWDIVMDITDALNADSGRAKRVLAHLKRVLERGIATSSDNQQLQNCLNVIDSLTRNGGSNIVSVIHSSFLQPLGKLAVSSDRDNVKLKSLLQSSENKKNCKDRVLELILDWQEVLDQAQYPNFRATFVELKRNGAAFDKIIAERERIRKQQEFEAKNRCFSAEQKQDAVEYHDEPTLDNPWSKKHLPFGRWYKAKLKADISKLIDMICMAQDIMAMGNAQDAMLCCMELREAHKRLLCIVLRTDDPPAIDCFLQLVTIISNILDCYKALSNGKKYCLPGVSRQFLHMLIRIL